MNRNRAIEGRMFEIQDALVCKLSHDNEKFGGGLGSLAKAAQSELANEGACST